MLIDTHAHLFYEGLRERVEEIIGNARVAGVEKIVVPGVDVFSSAEATTLANKYPGQVWAAVGVHPEEAGVEVNKVVTKLQELIETSRGQVVAVGEVGIDLNTLELREKLKLQEELLQVQVGLAKEYNLPVVVHTRNSASEALAILVSEKITLAQFHCFSGTEEELLNVTKRGYYVSFCGNVSWSRRVRELCRLVPNDRILLETDSPFMTPRNAQGNTITKLNEPANVKILAETIARARGVSVEELATQTSANAERLFGI